MEICEEERRQCKIELCRDLTSDYPDLNLIKLGTETLEIKLHFNQNFSFLIRARQTILV